MKNKTNRQFKIAIIAMLTAIVLVVASCIRFNALGDKSSASSQVEKTPETAATSEAVEPSQFTASSESAATTGVFVGIKSDGPTLQGKNGTKTSMIDGKSAWEKNKAFAEKYCTEASAVDGMKTFIGNQVYAIPQSVIEGSGDGDMSEEYSDTLFVQLYGYSLSYVDSTGWMANVANARQEKTGKRIYVFDYQEQADAYKAAWDRGQAILDGTEAGPENGIIVNGRFIEGYTARLVNGEYYIPLKAVAYAVDKDTFNDDTKNSKVTFSIPTPTGYSYVTVPYSATSVGSTHYNNVFESGNYDESAGEIWTDKFNYGDTNACFVPASQLMRYTGWYIYTDGNIVSIISDETDVSDMFVVNTQGNQSSVEQLKSGNTVTKYTDPNDKKLIDGYNDSLNDTTSESANASEPNVS